MLPAQVYDVMDRSDGGMYLRVPYDEDFLEEFKIAVPDSQRELDWENRVWWVSEKYSRPAIRIAQEHFDLEYEDSGYEFE